MKTYLAAMSAAMLTAIGCTVTHIDGPTWSMSRISLFQRPEIQEVQVATNGTTTLTGYRNGQDIQPVIEAAVSSAVTAATKAVTP